MIDWRIPFQRSPKSSEASQCAQSSGLLRVAHYPPFECFGASLYQQRHYTDMWRLLRGSRIIRSSRSR
jgi:hypothetical protein